MNLRERNLQLALLKAVADAVQKAMAELREDHLVTLLDSYDNVGVKAFVVKLPGDPSLKVATITLAEQKEAYEVTDEKAFLKWSAANRPDSVETVITPTVRKRTFKQVNPRAQTAYLKELRPGDGGIAFDPTNGEVVEGVTYRPAGRPKSFAVRYETEGRDRLIDAWRLGELADIVGSDVLPQIGGL